MAFPGPLLALSSALFISAVGAPQVDAPPPSRDAERFDMQDERGNRSADDFDAWMERKDLQVATGEPADASRQDCPTSGGDTGDDDGDGVINCLDQCPNSERGQTIGSDGCPEAIAIDLKGVTFGHDQATLDATAKRVLDEAAEILKRHETLRVEVAGHTDASGDAAYNQALSERRARVVYDYLVASGIDSARLIGPVGYGETRPLVPETAADGASDPQRQRRNRRTELNVQG